MQKVGESPEAPSLLSLPTEKRGGGSGWGVAEVAMASVAGLLLATPATALAYRPFDGTDAAVAEKGEFELELGPVGYYQVGQERDLVLPALVLNYGIVVRVVLVSA